VRNTRSNFQHLSANMVKMLSQKLGISLARCADPNKQSNNSVLGVMNTKVWTNFPRLRGGITKML